jgi:hypothetical protein
MHVASLSSQLYTPVQNYACIFQIRDTDSLLLRIFVDQSLLVFEVYNVAAACNFLALYLDQ